MVTVSNGHNLMKLLMNQLVLPNRTIDVEELQVKYGKTSEEARATIGNTGFLSLRWARTNSAIGFLNQAYTTLSGEFVSACQNVKVLICVTQSQEQRTPNLAANVQAALSIETDLLALDIIDGCNGFIKALRTADALLAPGEKALIVSGEMNSPMLEEAELATKVLFGDGFAFTLVERENEIAPAIIKNDGQRGAFIEAAFSNSILKMNGFEVFRFTNAEVPQLVNACNWIQRNEGEASEVFVMHQASKLVVHQIAKRLHVLDQYPAVFSMNRIGNLASGSIPGWMAINHDRLVPGCILHCLGFGAGLSWGLITVKNSLSQNGVSYVEA